MGLRFNLSSANVLAYLTAQDEREPLLPRVAVDEFLEALIDPYQRRQPLISESAEFVLRFQRAAQDAQDRLASQPVDYQDFLDPKTVRAVLSPLAYEFSRYLAFVLPVGAQEDRDQLEGFAVETALRPGVGMLVLIPETFDISSVGVMQPGTGVAQALREVDCWPGAIFELKNGESAFAPLDEAYRVAGRLSEALSSPSNPDSILRAATAIILEAARRQPVERKRILHLSDLHLGTKASQKAQVFLRANISREIGEVDHLVITGDLFDSPLKRQAQQFENFSNDLKIMGFERAIVVPGNHDQRILGNSVLGFGKRLQQLAELRWSSIVPDDDRRLVFLCFNSSHGGQFARGRIDAEQLLSVATRFDVDNVRGRFDGYLRVALLHHHPYPYLGDHQREQPIIDPRNWKGHEKFVGMDEGDDFLSWCAGRGVSLILHGHKHRPRLVVEDLPSIDGRKQMICTAGCGTSLGANGSPLSYNIVEWNPDSQRWTVDFRQSRADGRGFQSLYMQAEVVS